MAPRATGTPAPTGSVTSPADREAFVREWEEWHRRHEAARADRYGFLAITGLYWLTEEPQRLPDAPGEWSTGPDGVVVTLAPGEELVVDGETVGGRYVFGVIPERGEVKARWGDAVIEVARRGGNDIVRPRHPDNPVRTGYPGTPAFPPDPRWVVTGRFVGLHLLIKGAAGAAGGELARHVYRENAPAALLLAAVATVGQELLHALVLRVFSVVVPLAHVFELLPTIITGNLVAAGVLFVPLYRLTRDLAGEPAGRAAGSWPARGGGR